ncbi:hypothetical protein IPA_07880 [Ignicoccus pacificus DSM 13166]|uniref:Uncharacterized protein n=1 Tax=Ignicoccus pacificus DSM 13166 TaxID=940294 RepID=A0A977KD74_9CREN|nr:hypothetical protein IPA_07880 [Ignicoccus pacificus DSM 13166]
MLLVAWILAFLLPPLAIFALPDKCVPNKGEAAVVAFILMLIFFPLAWLYVFPKVSTCETMLSAQQATTKVVIPQGTEKGQEGKVIVINVGSSG